MFFQDLRVHRDSVDLLAYPMTNLKDIILRYICSPPENVPFSISQQASIVCHLNNMVWQLYKYTSVE